MKLDPRSDTLWRTYLCYFLILLVGVAIIVKIIIVQAKDSKAWPRNANIVWRPWRPHVALSSRATTR